MPLLLAALVGALVAALVTGGLFLVFDDEDPTPAPAANLTLEEAGLDIQGVLAEVGPSVVAIETDSRGVVEVFESAGSGIIISADGLVVTNAHVIQDATSIEVTLYDGSQYAADLVGAFPDEDVALVQLRDLDEDLVPATLGSSADLQVGDDVIAIGNALNLGGQPSVTVGIVSALDRSIDAQGLQLENLVQTDAAINPGNSGGPLVNAQGEIVGMNTAIIQDSQNVGFSIAVDHLEPLIEDLRNGEGDLSQDSAFLGISTVPVGDVVEATIEEFAIDLESGAFVVDVRFGSSADEMGIEPGDVITSIDGEDVNVPEDVASIIDGHQPGDEIVVDLVRRGEELSITGELGRRGG